MKTSVLTQWVTALKTNTYALYLASRDSRVPLWAKLFIGLVVAYALSPIDFIPDFIPIIGYLDDLLLLALGTWLAIRLIPREVWRECQLMAASKMAELPRNYRAAVVIIIIWLLLAGGFMLWIWKLFSS